MQQRSERYIRSARMGAGGRNRTGISRRLRSEGAGAQSLVATLTKVDPESAHELSLEFYRQWLVERVSKAEALRRAQVRLANQRVEPRHWASHLLIGDYS